MKIVGSIYNIDELNKCQAYLDCAILMSKNISLVYEDLDLDMAIDFCLKNDIRPIVGINKIFQPSDIKYAHEALNKYKDNSEIYFYAADISVCSIALDLGIQNRVIFNPETMITNSYDLDIYKSFGFDALAMSLEITLDDLIKSYNDTKAPLFYLGFGHRMMFYSKRRLITLYGNKNGTRYEGDKLYLKESTREDMLPIIENNNGTMIYRSYLISLMDNIDRLSFLKYFYCDSLYLDSQSYLKALEAYYAVAHNEIAKEEGLKIIKGLNLDIEDGFTYQDSVYQKEELKR